MILAHPRHLGLSGLIEVDDRSTIKESLVRRANYHRHVVRQTHGSDASIAHLLKSVEMGTDEGTRTKARAGSTEILVPARESGIGPSSVKPAMTKDSQISVAALTPRALPSYARQGQRRTNRPSNL